LDPTSPSESIVTLQDVSVSYGARQALSHVTATFPRGATGLLGANGAGKSTLIRAILGLITPYEGRIDVLGLSAVDSALDIRTRIGYVPESDAYIPGLNAVASSWPDCFEPMRSNARTTCCRSWALTKHDTETSTRFPCA